MKFCFVERIKNFDKIDDYKKKLTVLIFAYIGLENRAEFSIARVKHGLTDTIKLILTSY